MSTKPTKKVKKIKQDLTTEIEPPKYNESRLLSNVLDKNVWLILGKSRMALSAILDEVKYDPKTESINTAIGLIQPADLICLISLQNSLMNVKEESESEGEIDPIEQLFEDMKGEFVTSVKHKQVRILFNRTQYTTPKILFDLHQLNSMSLKIVQMDRNPKVLSDDQMLIVNGNAEIKINIRRLIKNGSIKFNIKELLVDPQQYPLIKMFLDDVL